MPPTVHQQSSLRCREQSSYKGSITSVFRNLGRGGPVDRPLGAAWMTDGLRFYEGFLPQGHEPMQGHSIAYLHGPAACRGY